MDVGLLFVKFDNINKCDNSTCIAGNEYHLLQDVRSPESNGTFNGFCLLLVLVVRMS